MKIEIYIIIRCIDNNNNDNIKIITKITTIYYT